MSEEIRTADANLAEIARLRSELADAHEMIDRKQDETIAERIARRNAEADTAWWRATVANYVTSASVADRELLRMTMAGALAADHPGAALLGELGAARAVVAAARDVLAQGTIIGGETRRVLWLAMSAYDAATKSE